MGYKVLSAEISHETNTFSVRPTDLQAFRDRYLLDGPAAIAAKDDRNTELAGLLDVSRDQGWDLTHVISAAAGPGGRVTREAFETLLKPLLDAAAQGGWDGIFLMLHGAMVTTDHQDGEGEILRRLRSVIGGELPIAVTLDPHGNVSGAMCDLAQILVSFTTYPHVDIRATGRRAAELLHRTMAGDIHPRTYRAHCPMLEEANGGRTDIGPMIDRQAMARAYEARKGVYAISINGAFPCADIAEVGPTVLVTGEGECAHLRPIAEELADDIWHHRHETLNHYLTPEEAAEAARGWHPGGGCLIIADYADNPGSGAYGDATALLKALLDAGVEGACFGPLLDAEAATALQDVPVGAKVELPIGGKTAPEFGGGPLEVTGTVLWRGEGRVVGDGPILGGQARSFGKTAVLRVAGIDVLIVSIPHQMLDLQQFRTFGIDPAEKAVVALKSMQHFRAAFTPIAGRIIVCDTGALCTTQYDRLPYVHVTRPVFPLDRDGWPIDP
ncbi:M81 family metallopeptidase [Rhodophyticola porphyridii]|uniref:Microcystinase C n=1 Tax=Rhodophyticola porphyridii TaxID=1852017 RepID=A0A3L9YFJ0_9RHOB|nr:M81 family metallopeptidase [Rhodophyticola porphyridii]RMA41710.1 M81 family peptidase [Rhodophyticola porphyridii]